MKRSFGVALMIASLLLSCGCASETPGSATASPSSGSFKPSVSSTPTSESSTSTVTSVPKDEPDPKTSHKNDPEPPELSLSEKFLSEMTLEEKLAQMTIVAFDNLDEDVSRCFDECKPGGVILFSKNISTEAALRDLTDKLTEGSRRSGVPMFIGIDQEGGVVQRIKFSGNYPKAADIGASNDESYAYDNSFEIGTELASFGINLDFAPVMDVNSNPDNPVIGNRSFSNDPEVVSKMGTASMKGLRDAGIISCLKHFPGHGDTDTDSHTGLPKLNKTLADLKKTELVPFIAGINAGADMIMTAHIEFPQIETETKTLVSGEKISLPATLSYRILTELLREELGFEGVIVTDSLEMKAISSYFGITEATAYSICAGADLMLIPVRITGKARIDEYKKYLADLSEMVRSDIIPLERVNDSVLRILRLKEKYGLLD